jgi:hypothetical protein
MLDPWQRLQPIFDSEQQLQSEIELANLTPESLNALLQYIFEYSSSLETDFALRQPFRRIQVASRSDAIHWLLAGQVVGQIFLTLHIEGMRLPEMSIFVDGPDYMSVQYLAGRGWKPIHLTGLFEFLRVARHSEPGCYIGLSASSFSWEWRRRFEMTLREYLDE